MSKVNEALEQLNQFSLKLEEAIEKTLFETSSGDIIALYDYDGELEYKGIILYSNDGKAGEVEWFLFDDLKEIYVLG